MQSWLNKLELNAWRTELSDISLTLTMENIKEDPWEFLEHELQEFEKAMKALEEGKKRLLDS